MQVIVKFSPKKIRNFSATLFIKYTDKIFWEYPIKGITESVSNSLDFFMKTKCGQEI